MHSARLEEFLLYSILVAGKSAKSTERGLSKLLGELRFRYGEGSPFAMLRKLFADNTVDPSGLLKSCGIGCYNRRVVSLRSAAMCALNLETCTPSALEQVHGVGMKTSRFFILHTRKGYRCAVLDVHVLKYLRSKGVQAVPYSTPAKKSEYQRLEKEFLKLVPNGRSVASLDTEVWSSYAKL